MPLTLSKRFNHEAESVGNTPFWTWTGSAIYCDVLVLMRCILEGNIAKVQR